MRWLADLAYLVAAVVSAPLWLARLIRTGRIRTDWPGRFGRARVRPAPPGRRRVLLQAVSVGEVNAIRLLVRHLAESEPPLDIVVASTTDTGVRRARELFGDAHQVVRYPLDFSFAVERFLEQVRPDAVALAELEVWPAFTAALARRGVPACVVNGRLTERSHRGYRRLGLLVSPSFGRLAFVAAQNQLYADRFAELGVPPGRLRVTGTMKWDTAEIADVVEGAAELRDAMAIDPGRPLVVGGSTAPGEHELLVNAVPPGVQLLCAPRRTEWFDEAALVLAGCARRSRRERGSPTGRYLLDTIGELRLAYALADVVVIGRSFGSLFGSDMMEPVALGRAVVVGPSVADFQDTVEALLEGGGIIQVDAAELPRVLSELLTDPPRRADLARRGREVIRARQGATQRHAVMIRELLGQPWSCNARLLTT